MFPTGIITGALEKVAESVKGNTKRAAVDVDPKNRNNVVTLPYVHRLARELNNVASRYDVYIGFSAGHKLGEIYPAVHKNMNGVTCEKRTGCTVKHKNYVDCKIKAILRSCENTGQTSRCLNIRI